MSIKAYKNAALKGVTQCELGYGFGTDNKNAKL
jgi:acetone carboxylase gamma subunit